LDERTAGARMKRVDVPARLWYDNTDRELTFPDRWEVSDLASPGMGKPGLSPEEIRARLRRPVAGPALLDLARGRQQAVIVFDDMTRPTPVKDVAPHVLETLHEAGLRDDQIRFLWALGSHAAYDMIAARKKLGDAIVERYAVYNHDAFQNTVRVGATPSGLEIWLNREYMACDLRIGIGCVTAHVHAGYGGGAKLIMPGVAGLETIGQFHDLFRKNAARTGLGRFEGNVMRAEIDAAGDLSGLDFKVDCLVNRRGQIASLHAGSFRATHAAGAEEGKVHYGIPASGVYDVAVCNTYGKASESAIALAIAIRLLRPGAQGTGVIVMDAPEGQVAHHVMRAWGTGYGGRHYTPREPGFIRRFMKRLIVLNPYPDRTCLDLVCHPDDAVVVKTWPEVLRLLEEDFPGPARVGVVQDGTMEYVRA
jgi:lactate racemase